MRQQSLTQFRQVASAVSRRVVEMLIQARDGDIRSRFKQVHWLTVIVWCLTHSRLPGG